MPPSDHRVRGAWTLSAFLLLTHRSRKLGQDGGVAWNPPTIHTSASPRPTTPFVKGPVGQNTESLALDKHFTQNIWKGSSPRGHLIHDPASITL